MLWELDFIENPSTNVDEVYEDEAWKEDLEKSLFDNYGVIPKYYEDLGDGIYQVYVEVGGEVVPLVTVDSETGDYQVKWWCGFKFGDVTAFPNEHDNQQLIFST